MFGLEILKDIDKTLDKLVENAKTLSTIDLQDLSDIEKKAFESTQKNLLFHFFYLDKKFEEKKKALKDLKRSCQHFTSLKKKKSSEAQKVLKKLPRTNRPKKKVL